ncbi:MAG: DUF2213 domain-containing protein [Candidatus Bathyarchaeia archaeon]|jgi:hypothetical protein
MWKYGLKSVEADNLQIKEDEETLIVPAVITREGVYDYDGMLIYEPASEVEKAAFTALNAWVVEEHPPEIILSKPQLIRGTVQNPKFEKDRIKAELVFFKNRCTPQYLEDIKNGKARSVSIGFFFDCIPQSGEFRGQHYDYVKRDILIDHVAVGSWQGRCSYPLCGIGVDTVKGADPYPNEHSCRLKDPETLNIVGSGERKHNGKTYRVIFGKPKDKPDAGSVEQAYRYPIKTWSEAEARKHCQDHGGSFEPATREEGDIANKKQEDEGEREKLRKAAEEREKRYGIKFREDKGHLTPPKDYPQNEEDYADPVNYAYPLVPEDRCRNALASWSQFRQEYDQSERNIIYERIVKRSLQYGINVQYNPEMPEAKALPENIKKQLEGYKSADSLIAKVNILTKQLKGMI